MFFTVAWVPTGMKTGVRTSPCAVWKRPARAWEPEHSFSRVKERRDMACGGRNDLGCADADGKAAHARIAATLTAGAV